MRIVAMALALLVTLLLPGAAAAQGRCASLAGRHYQPGCPARSDRYVGRRRTADDHSEQLRAARRAPAARSRPPRPDPDPAMGQSAPRRPPCPVPCRRTLHALQTLARGARVSNRVRHRAAEPARQRSHPSLSNGWGALVPRDLHGWAVASTVRRAELLRTL